MLEQLWSVPDEELHQLWFDTADNYLKQSNKWISQQLNIYIIHAIQIER